MSDLIERQAAIDALAENKEMINAVLDSLTLGYNTRRNQEQRRGQINEDIETIKALPSAQPEPITEWQKDFREYINMLNIPRDDYKGIMEYIDEVPSAQRKGKWIATQEWGGRNYSCSCCKFSFIVDTCMLEPMWNFCPNCGALMKGEEDERIKNS